MLNYARQRVAEALRSRGTGVPQTAVLATSGPAGLLAGEFRCEASGLSLFLLVPRTSDHLFNLEQNPAVTLLSATWELNGEARVIAPGEAALNLDILHEPAAEWCVVVRVDARKVHIRRAGDWGNLETIDLQT